MADVENMHVNLQTPTTPGRVSQVSGKIFRGEPSTASGSMTGYDSPALSKNSNAFNRPAYPSQQGHYRQSEVNNDVRGMQTGWGHPAPRSPPPRFVAPQQEQSCTVYQQTIQFEEEGPYDDIQVLPLEASYPPIPSAMDRPAFFETVTEQAVNVERTLVREVEVPVQNIVYKNVDVFVERPIFRENYVEMPVPVDVIVEREIVIPVEHLVERPVYIERPVELHVDYPVEMPCAYEQVTEVPVEHRHEKGLEVHRAVPASVERVVRRSVSHVQVVEKPYEAIIERLVPRPVDHFIERRVNRYIERPVERVVERPVYIERLVEKMVEVERVIEIPLEQVREVVRTVERLVERPVYYDTVVEKEVEVIVERVVEVMVEKTVEVPVTIYVDRPVINETLKEEEVIVEANTVEVSEEAEVALEAEFFDEKMEFEINLRRDELHAAERQSSELLQRRENAQNELRILAQNCASSEHNERIALLVQYTDLGSRYNAAAQHRLGLEAKCKQRCVVIDHQINGSPIFDQLRSHLHDLLAENDELVRQLEQKTNALRRTLQEGPYI